MPYVEDEAFGEEGPEESADREDPDPADTTSDDESSDTAPCPHCRREIWEGAEVCPHCGNFLSGEVSPRRYSPWLVAGVVVCVVVVVIWVASNA